MTERRNLLKNSRKAAANRSKAPTILRRILSEAEKEIPTASGNYQACHLAYTLSMPFKYPCAYCGTSYTDKRDSVFNGMLLKCARCGKLTRVDLVKDDEDTRRVTMGQFYKPDE